MDSFIGWVSAATLGNKLKAEFKSTFGESPAEREVLPDEYDPRNETYDKELHQSRSSKWAQLRHNKSLNALKSSAVKEAQERRAAAADAKARGKR